MYLTRAEVTLYRRTALAHWTAVSVTAVSHHIGKYVNENGIEHKTQELSFLGGTLYTNK